MKTEYDETVEDYEARPPMRRGPTRARVLRERWRRIAEGSLFCVMSRDGYAYSQHSHERENARRLRQMSFPWRNP